MPHRNWARKPAGKVANNPAFGRFRLGYGRLGPTEARVALVALNVALALGAGLHFDLWGVGLSTLDVVGLGAAALMLVLLAFRAFGNLRELAAAEPSGRKRGCASSGGPAATAS